MKVLQQGTREVSNAHGCAPRRMSTREASNAYGSAPKGACERQATRMKVLQGYSMHKLCTLMASTDRSANKNTS